GVPGIRNRHPGISPEKIAIAVAVTIAAIAMIGGMKNVTGTSSAVAIVAVKPGTAPTNRPNNDAPSITKTVFGSKTIWNATKSGSTDQDTGIDGVKKRTASARPMEAARAAACKTRNE